MLNNSFPHSLLFGVLYLLSICVKFSHPTSLQLSLCRDSLVKNDFFIPPPQPCVEHNTTFMETCHADVFIPSQAFQKVTIYTCEILKTTVSTTFYFFGAKTHSDRTKAVSPPSASTCADWKRTLDSSCCGSLSQKSSTTWATSKSPNYKYIWPTSHKESIENAVLTTTTAVFNHLRKKLVSPIYSLSHCDVNKKAVFREQKFIFGKHLLL